MDQGHSQTRNIFTATSRYAYRQGENFLTEGLAFVLETLRTEEPVAFQQFIQRMTGRNLPIVSSDLIVTTQESTEQGRPDLAISQRLDFVLFIEVKDRSTLGWRQLERYHLELAKRDETHKQLFLLTRSRLAARHATLSREHYTHILWHQISAWLTDLPISGSVPRYIIKSYISFLEDSQMSLIKINSYGAGASEMHRMIELFTIALRERLPSEDFRPSNPWQKWIGYFWQEDKNWFGFYFDNPTVLWIEKGGTQEPRPKLSLNLEETGFFNLDSGAQLDALINFINRGVNELGIPQSPSI
jgi:hypothetical protein